MRDRIIYCVAVDGHITTRLVLRKQRNPTTDEEFAAMLKPSCRPAPEEMFVDPRMLRGSALEA